MTRSRGESAESERRPGMGDLAPVYLLHGEEELLREEKLRSILDAAVPEEHRSFNLDVLTATDADIRDIVAKASSFPMMAERRAVVVKDVEKFDKDDLELLTNYVDHPMESTVLILTSQKVDLRKKPFAGLKGAGRALEFKPLKEADLPDWITKRVKAKGRSIDSGATRLLASFAGSSLRDLDQELDKLILYAGGRATLTQDDVAAVAGISKEYNIWELQHSIAAGECRTAVDIVTRMIQDGYGAPYFVVMLTSFFATVRKIHDLRRRGNSLKQVASELQRNPYSLQDQFEAAERFSAYETERALALLLAVDDKAKFGGDDAALLQTMLIEFLGTTSPRR